MHRLVVVDGEGRVEGIVSLSDIVRFLVLDPPTPPSPASTPPLDPFDTPTAPWKPLCVRDLHSPPHTLSDRLRELNSPLIGSFDWLI